MCDYHKREQKLNQNVISIGNRTSISSVGSLLLLSTICKKVRIVEFNVNTTAIAHVKDTGRSCLIYFWCPFNTITYTNLEMPVNCT